MSKKEFFPDQGIRETLNMFILVQQQSNFPSQTGCRNMQNIVKTFEWFWIAIWAYWLITGSIWIYHVVNPGSCSEYFRLILPLWADIPYTTVICNMRIIAEPWTVCGAISIIPFVCVHFSLLSAECSALSPFKLALLFFSFRFRCTQSRGHSHD